MVILAGQDVATGENDNGGEASYGKINYIASKMFNFVHAIINSCELDM